MISRIYNYFNQEEYDEAENLVGFLTDRIAEIKGKIKLTDSEKKTKIKRIQLSIQCIKYCYNM
jgi:hypothetical protein|tara:strand:- start:439 stop:627 length:189 start_codon:yes stop_codon:yes gene_type:complete